MMRSFRPLFAAFLAVAAGPALGDSTTKLRPPPPAFVPPLLTEQQVDGAVGALDGLVADAMARTGVPGDAVVQNASLVGRAAGVALPQLTPYYVAHLLSLHLVEVGAEDERLIDGYQALLVEPTVLGAMARAGGVMADVEADAMGRVDRSADVTALEREVVACRRCPRSADAPASRARC